MRVNAGIWPLGVDIGADAGFEAAFAARLHWSADTDAAIEQRVADILADVQQRGDAAVLAYTQRFDGLQAADVKVLEITQAELQAALDSLPTAQREALQAAAARVRQYHEAQKKASGESWSYRDEDGTLLGQKVTPLDRVGIYVPGGKAAYPSSVLMNALPAHVAGVQEIIMVVPTPQGVRNPLVLAAACVAGVSRAFTVGGAQAVAALAYGTATIPKVDKITGPGNAYVASAKKRVFGTVGIDMIAGPSEILVLADGTTPAEWVAMDLFSQAEHDVMAASVLVTTSVDLADAVDKALAAQLEITKHRERVTTALTGSQSGTVLVSDVSAGLRVVNAYAAEHLEIQTEDATGVAAQVTSAGAVFVGPWAPVSLGDYMAGSSHVLPTGQQAKFGSGLGVHSFLRPQQIIDYSREGLEPIAKLVQNFANAEGLPAHGEAVSARFE